MEGRLLACISSSSLCGNQQFFSSMGSIPLDTTEGLSEAMNGINIFDTAAKEKVLIFCGTRERRENP